MNAHTVVVGIAVGSIAALVVWMFCIWGLGPLRLRLSNTRTINEDKTLADAEEAAWEDFRDKGVFPGVDGELLTQPGWENALAVPAGRPFAKKAVERG